MAKINFTKVNGIYEAEFTATGVFELHVATTPDTLLSIYAKGNDNSEYILKWQSREGIHNDIVGEVWPKKFKVICDNEPIEATYKMKE